MSKSKSKSQPKTSRFVRRRRKSQYKERPLFITFMGEHTVIHVLNSGDCPEPRAADPNAILVIRDSQNREVSLLGSELTDLSKQWLKVKRLGSDFTVCPACNRGGIKS